MYKSSSLPYYYGVLYFPNRSNDFQKSNKICFHGRHQTFFQRRAKFFEWGQNILFALKTTKRYYFSQNNSKNTIFWPPMGGQEPPLAFPCGHPCMFSIYYEFFNVRLFFRKKIIHR